MLPRSVPEISPLDAFCDAVVVGVGVGIGDSRSWIELVAGSLRHDIDPSLCGGKPLCAKLPEGKGGVACNHPKPGETKIITCLGLALFVLSKYIFDCVYWPNVKKRPVDRNSA